MSFRHTPQIRVFLLLLLCLFNACRQYSVHERFNEIKASYEYRDLEAGQLQVFFLGTGGIYLRSHQATLLADPFFSNPSFWRVLPLVRTESNEQLIKSKMEQLPDLSLLQAVLVSHSHYDHAMDLPFILQNYASDVPIYGNSTLVNLLADLKNDRIKSLSSSAVGPSPGEKKWIDMGPWFKVTVIESQHLNHFMFYKYASGDCAGKMAIPKRLMGWCEGDTYSFVIDVRSAPHGEEILWRIFFMPSPTHNNIGFPPKEILAERKIDLAIIGATQLQQADGYPQELLKVLAPDAVLIVHWDNFFDNNKSVSPTLSPLLNPNELASRLNLSLAEDIPVFWPQRNSYLTLPITVQRLE